MGALVALTAASFIIALERCASGKLDEDVSPEHFTEVYRCVFRFIEEVVLANAASREVFVEYCTLLISHATAVLGQGILDDEDNDF